MSVLNGLPIDLVVLDMAGTTVDEGLAVYRVLAETARAFGASPTDAEIDLWHGADKREALRVLLRGATGQDPDEAVLGEAVDEFRARLNHAYLTNPPKPLPGIVSALSNLRQAGVAVYLSTGFDRDVVDVLIRTLGWGGNSVVDGVVCASDVAAGRPAPFMIFRAMELAGVTDPARVLIAGDTPRDLEAGMNANAGFVVGVLSGASTVEQLGSVRHTHLLRSVANIHSLVQG